MILIFKLFLLAIIAVIGYLFFFRVQSRLLNRVFVSVVGLSVAVFVVAPDLSTRVAGFFGIGRGTDFVLYLSQVLLYLIVVLLYLRTQVLETKLTSLVRSQALQDAKTPEK